MDDERLKITNQMRIKRMIREAERWLPILGGMKPYDAAVRILGDLCGYRKYYRGSDEASYYRDDVEKLGAALLAIAALAQGDGWEPES